MIGTTISDSDADEQASRNKETISNAIHLEILLFIFTDVTRKLMNIRHQNCFFSRPTRATDAFIMLDSRTSQRSLDERNKVTIVFVIIRRSLLEKAREPIDCFSLNRNRPTKIGKFP